MMRVTAQPDQRHHIIIVLRLVCNTDKFEGIYNMAIPDKLYDTATLLKSDVLGQNRANIASYYKQYITIFSLDYTLLMVVAGKQLIKKNMISINLNTLTSPELF